MNVKRALQVTAKDLRLGPRSPFFLWALALPVILTFLVSAVFGDLFDPAPRLAVVDEGSSTVTTQLLGLEGLAVDVLDDEESLLAAVESHDYDAGLVLPADLDAQLATGGTPELRFFVSGQSLASTRVVLAVTTLEQLRAAAGQAPATEVVITRVGDQEFVPIENRLLPFIVLYAVMIAGLFLPATSLVEEREHRTLDALLVTPLRVSEVLFGKAALGVLLALVMGWVTLALNDAFAGQPLAMTVFLLAGAVMMAEVGLILGCWARDSNTLFTAVKGGGILVFAPVIFTLFPDLPQWIARIFPTYYFLQPIFEIATTGAGLGEYVVELAVCVLVCLALLPGVAAYGRRFEAASAETV